MAATASASWRDKEGRSTDELLETELRTHAQSKLGTDQWAHWRHTHSHDQVPTQQKSITLRTSRKQAAAFAVELAHNTRTTPLADTGSLELARDAEPVVPFSVVVVELRSAPSSQLSSGRTLQPHTVIVFSVGIEPTVLSSASAEPCQLKLANTFADLL